MPSDSNHALLWPAPWELAPPPCGLGECTGQSARFLIATFDSQPPDGRSRTDNRALWL